MAVMLCYWLFSPSVFNIKPSHSRNSKTKGFVSYPACRRKKGMPIHKPGTHTPIWIEPVSNTAGSSALDVHPNQCPIGTWAAAKNVIMSRIKFSLVLQEISTITGVTILMPYKCSANVFASYCGLVKDCPEVSLTLGYVTDWLTLSIPLTVLHIFGMLEFRVTDEQ